MVAGEFDLSRNPDLVLRRSMLLLWLLSLGASVLQQAYNYKVFLPLCCSLFGGAHGFDGGRRRCHFFAKCRMVGGLLVATFVPSRVGGSFLFNLGAVFLSKVTFV